MFKIRFLVRIFKTYTEVYAVLHRDLELPFVPYPGLELEDEDWTFSVEDVFYDVGEEIFKCPVDDRPAVNEERSSEDLADIIADYVAAGWRPLKRRVAE